ncbi:MAG TPA: isoaspartyl peptidase/L-asparaginase, partial [Bacteroidota bacterium]|nr:isoaspartyl peptidase/L-asparaginase [Bacteroidota bacterium]
MKRRTFIGTAALLGLPAGKLAGELLHPGRALSHNGIVSQTPAGRGNTVIVSTWNFAGASEAASDALSRGASPLDAVEAGIRVTEADPANTSVGIGGYPDRDGHLTLDASIMDGSGKCGS